jgi:hypothetical protein
MLVMRDATSAVADRLVLLQMVLVQVVLVAGGIGANHTIAFSIATPAPHNPNMSAWGGSTHQLFSSTMRAPVRLRHSVQVTSAASAAPATSEALDMRGLATIWTAIRHQMLSLFKSIEHETMSALDMRGLATI